MDTLLKDLRYAIRWLRKTPGFTAVAVLTLALGIGLNTTIFSCLNALLFRPMPYPAADRLINIMSEHTQHGWRNSEISYPDFRDWQAESKSFVGMAAYGNDSYNLASTGESPEWLEGESVSANLFEVLGIAPALGRGFRAEEDRPGAPHVVILSDALWRRRFAADPAIVGRDIRLNGDAYTVIGVMPPRFEFPADAKLWTPLALDPTADRGNHYLTAIGRLRPGVTAQQAASELDAISARLAERFPETNTGISADLVELHEHQVGQIRPVLYLMMGAVAFVLLIACANMANLLLVRASARQREIAVRVALGAGRGRIVRQLLTESLLLALLGGVAGILIAVWELAFIDAAVPADRPFWMRFTIDGRVLLFTAAVCVGSAIVFGLVPALQAVRPSLQETLKEGTRGAGLGPRQRLRNTLVVAEVALSLVLLIGAALMVRSSIRLQYADPGFIKDGVLTARVSLQGAAYDSADRRMAFIRELESRIEALPGVEAASTINYLPLTSNNTSSGIEIEGQVASVADHPEASWRTTTAGYASVMRIPLRRGRYFSEREVEDSARVVVVGEAMVHRFWRDHDPIGQRLRFFGDTGARAWFTVTGVANDVRLRWSDAAPRNQFYIPYTQAPWRSMSIAVRTAAAPAGLTPLVRDAARAIDPNLPLYSVATMAQVVQTSTWDRRLYAWLFGIFGAVALVLASVGLYSVIAYTVAQRTQEIGVRMALGAVPRDITRLVLRRGLALTIAGVAIGLAGAFGVTRLLHSVLYGVSATEAVSFVGISLLLTGVAALASWAPARRAARIDPLTALRTE